MKNVLCNATIKIWVAIGFLLGNLSIAVGQVNNPAPYGANTLVNYVRSWTATAPVQSADTLVNRPLTDSKEETKYIDGVGRPIQTVIKQITPAGHDLVTSVVRYDQYAREQYDYLPFSANSFQAGDIINDGDFKFTPFQQDSVFNQGQFPGQSYYYAQTNYEASPLNRVVSKMAQGDRYVGSGRGTGIQYLVNGAGDSVHLWSISSSPNSLPVDAGIFPAATLYKTITIDENNHQIVEYKDLDGHTILRKVQALASPGTGHVGWLNTYYIYDSLESIRYVLSPRAVELINTGASWTLTPSIANELCYRYEYDGRMRMIIKKVPGAGEIWMVYDARDRVVMTQDSNLRVSSPAKWHVFVYDSLNRVTQTGLLTDANNRAYHQNLSYNSVSYPSTSANFELLTQNYMDDYSWVAGSGSGLGSDIDSSFFSNSNYFITTYATIPYYAVRMSRNIQMRGMITGFKSEVVNSGGTYQYGVLFYDDHNRIIQTRSTNYSGGKDTVSTQYNFYGDAIRNYAKHQKSGATNPQGHTVLTKLEYDAANRLKRIWKNVDNTSSDQLIDSVQYNELGQMATKYLGRGMDSLAYVFNIRGWLSTINRAYLTGGNGNFFGEEVGYDTSVSVVGSTSYTNPQFNGNLAGSLWKSKGDGVARKYDFSYDLVNRLTAGYFRQNTNGDANWDNSTINYSVGNLKYDANGNILTMSQMGFKMGTSSTIDSLNYIYKARSNKDSLITDVMNDTASKLGDFHYKSKGSYDYLYDGNGNITLDNNKGISGIVYNYLNLPQQISILHKGTITYGYDAGGNKLSKTVVDSTVTPVKTTKTMYLGDFQYANDTLQLIAHEEGRVRWAYHKYTTGTSGYGYEYDFNEKDHLGNNRVLLTQEKDTAQYMATMEAAYRTTENALFYNIPASSYYRGSVLGIPADGTTSPNDSIARVNGSGQKVGPAIILKVMAGDTVTIGCKSFYTTQTGTGTNSSFNDVLNSLGAGFQNLTNGAEGTVAQLTGVGAPLYSALNSFITTKDQTVPSKPRAYLNWMLMDNQLKYDSTYPQSGAIPVSNYAAGTLGTPGYGPYVVAKSGYLFVYVSNETQGWDVFFDNLTISVRSGRLTEEAHYYPFGLTMAGISDNAVKTQYTTNKYRFNGQELQNKEFSDASGLEQYDYGERPQDPQTGRWNAIDPDLEMYESVSPYSFGFNNPSRYFDQGGSDPGDMIVFFTGMNLGQPKTASIGWMINHIVGFINGGSIYEYRSRPIGHLLFSYATKDAYQDVLDNVAQYPKGRIVIYGYSYGGQLANYLAKRLEKVGIRVTLLVTVDAAAGLSSNSVDRTISGNVDLNVNFFQKNYLWYKDPLPNHGDPNKPLSKGTTVLNFDLSKEKFIDDNGEEKSVYHVSVDEASKIATVNYIMSVLYPRYKPPMSTEEFLNKVSGMNLFDNTQKKDDSGNGGEVEFKFLFGVY
ncbi:MAG: DUF6443 domain-containing protein [Puia sp.]|nr:DUF6443 domain-containing protein [Puia sp.]